MNNSVQLLDSAMTSDSLNLEWHIEPKALTSLRILLLSPYTRDRLTGNHYAGLEPLRINALSLLQPSVANTMPKEQAMEIQW